MPDRNPIIQLNGGGGGRDGPPPPPPPPPNPFGGRPQGMPGAGGRPQPGQAFPPQGMDPRAMQAQPMPLPMMPIPGREVVPHSLRPRRNVETIDLRKERVTEKDMRDELSEFVIYRFEKVQDDEGYDLDGNKINTSWSNCHRSVVTDVSREDAFRQVARLMKTSQGVVAKKKALNPEQQRQLERALEDLERTDPDPSFQYELAQIDDQLKLLDPSMMTSVYRKHSSHHHHHSRHHRPQITKIVHKSSDRKHHKKRVWQRISLTAYYKRVPKPDANIFALYDERERRKHVLPPHQQEQLAREMSLERERQHMQHQQHQMQMQMEMQHGRGAPPAPGHFGAPGGGNDPRGPQNGPPIRVINDGGKGGGKGDKGSRKGSKNRRHSDSDSSSSRSDSGSLWSEGSGSRDTGTTLTSSHSHDRRRRKSKHYLEEPGPTYYGAGKPQVTRRHSRDGQIFSPLVPAPPVALLPPTAPDVDTIKAHAYELGRADGRFEERRENLADDLQFERDRLREAREERELEAMEREREREAERHERELQAARRQRRLTAPPPRVVQEVPWARHNVARQIGIRHVTESEVDRQQEADDIIEKLRRMKMREPSESDYTDELRMPASPRRRYAPRTLSVEEELLDHDEWRTGRRRGEAVDYMRRRASSPGVSPDPNPFSPKPRGRRGEQVFFD